MKILSVLTLLLIPQISFAFQAQQHTVDGKEFIFVAEYADSVATVNNEVTLRVRASMAGEDGEAVAVEGLEESTEVQIFKDDKNMIVPIISVGSGLYEARFIPTEEGTYGYRLFGTFEELSLDVHFTCGAETYDDPPQTLTSVEGVIECPSMSTTVEFPEQPTVEQLISEAVSRSDLAQNEQFSALENELVNAQKHRAVTIVIGLAGVLLGTIALSLKRKK